MGLDISAFLNTILLNKTMQIAFILVSLVLSLKALRRKASIKSFILDTLFGWIVCNFIWFAMFYLIPLLQ